MYNPEMARLGSYGEDYRRFGLSQDDVAVRENGMRTDGAPGSYEWWYLDGHLQDETTLVVVFHTKPTDDVGAPFTPYTSVTIDRPDGTHIERRIKVAPEDFAASPDETDIRMGRNTLRKTPAEWSPESERAGKYGYDLIIEDEGLHIDLGLYAEMPMWRPGTGHFLFGDKNYFAWLAAVPYGEIQGYMAIDGRRRHINGSGYHDHNWGNAPIGQLLRGWEWYRGNAGRCGVLAADLYPHADYGGGKLPVFMLAQYGAVVTDDPRRVDSFLTGDESSVTRHFEYPKNGKDEHHEIMFTSEGKLSELPLTQSLGKVGLPDELEAGSLYRRFTGTMEHRVRAVGRATTEQMRLSDT
jgi:hypothetical protein